MDVFNEVYSRCYDLLYADKDYSKEADYVDKVIKKYYPSARSILEYGSGTGRHGLLLMKKGYHVFGIERSREMASVARSNGFLCDVGDIVETKVNGRFDVCICLFHVISYINSDADLVRLFNKTRKNLKPGGIFMFDVWFSPAVLRQRAARRVKTAEDDNVEVVRIAEPVTHESRNIIEVNYHLTIRSKTDGRVTQVTEVHSMRYFNVSEIDLLASQTGLSLITAEEFVSGNEPSESTWGVAFILRAK